MQGSRPTQQDAYAVGTGGDKAYCVVVDGMGGMIRGDEAAQRALSASVGVLDAGGSPLDAVLAAQAAVHRWASQGGILGRTGATMAVAAVNLRDGTLEWASVGDCRVYLFKGGRLSRLSLDHNVSSEMVLLGRGPVPGPAGEMITSFIGIENLTEISTSEAPLPLEAGEGVLVVSDGVYRSLHEDRIAMALSRGSDARGILQEVEAQGRPYQDNATLALVIL
nr:PP2C family protein-serine/threonine phosphatase [Thermanaerovibrio acidaminovorans]